MRLDSHYGVCFRTCLARIIQRLREKDGRDVLHIVLERGHHNATDCERIFNDFKNQWIGKGADLFGTFTIQDKKSCMPLMVADLLAATYSMMRSRDSIDEFVLEKPKKGSLILVELAPDALRGLKENYEANRQQRIIDWRANRDARRLSDPSLAALG